MAYTLSLAGMMEIHIRHIIYIVTEMSIRWIQEYMQTILSAGIMWGEYYEKDAILHFARGDHVIHDGLPQSAGKNTAAL